MKIMIFIVGMMSRRPLSVTAKLAKSSMPTIIFMAACTGTTASLLRFFSPLMGRQRVGFGSSRDDIHVQTIFPTLS